VAQGIIKSLGAVIILYFLFTKIPGGLSQVIHAGMADHKFSLGSFRPDFSIAGFWVIFLYGIFINLNNFGMDQNYVQRFQSTATEAEARKSLWMCVQIYLPVSMLFFLIGTALYTYYQGHPADLDAVRLRAAMERLPSGASTEQVKAMMASLKPSDYGDKVLPQFMVTMLPRGVVGVIIAAILSAAMSTISSGLNSTATVFTIDIYKRHLNKALSDKGTFRVLLISTVVVGLLSLLTGLALIGTSSVLDAWWKLSGIFSAGILGLFLLGIISKRAGNAEAITGLIIGTLAIVWMVASPLIPDQYAGLRSTLHLNMSIVIGAMTILLVGMLLARRSPSPTPS
jgi:solute:Na+ symporter, SSS family